MTKRPSLELKDKRGKQGEERSSAENRVTSMVTWTLVKKVRIKIKKEKGEI